MPRSPFKQSESKSHGSLKRTTAAMRGVLPKRKRRTEPETQGTLQEGPSYISTSWEQSLDPAFTRPSISQIAMGLHLSHTPQGRRRSSSPVEDTPPSKIKSTQAPRHHRQSSLPPPTATRSALKKSSAGVDNGTPSLTTTSSSCSSSNALSTPTSARSLRSFKLRMASFLPHSSAASTASFVTGYAPSSEKSVRFNDT